LYAFGHGLSYTQFEYSNLRIGPAAFDVTKPLTVTFEIENTGRRAGADVAQLYVGEENPPVERPAKEL